MSTELTISFRAPHADPASGVVPLGRRQFRLYTGPEGIALPEVVLEQEGTGGSRMVTVHLPARIEIITPSGGLVPAQLAQALADCWVPKQYTSITVEGPRTLSQDTMLPTALVHPASAPRPPRATSRCGWTSTGASTTRRSSTRERRTAASCWSSPRRARSPRHRRGRRTTTSS